jgi:glycosyltransferase involved in cell wall biosynthesis
MSLNFQMQSASAKDGAKSAVPRYVVISPVRDEAQYIENTIRSMVGQTVKPVQWILVDDGSTDATAEIIDRWAAQYSCITPVHRPDRGRRAAGSGVMEAFFDGLRSLTVPDWNFLVKLDGDVSFEPTYFSDCFAEFARDTKLGIGGGVICHEVDGQWDVESNPRFHVRGATKIYRRECWEAIGGLIRTPGWDTMDEVKANQLGWHTRSFPSLQLRHYRCTGAADGAWKNSVKNGLGSYICGFHPLFVLFRSIKNIAIKPYFTRSIGLLYGFVLGYFKNLPQVDDEPAIKYLRSQQLRRLSLRETIWR